MLTLMFWIMYNILKISLPIFSQVRHIKLVHSQNSYSESNSSIVGEGGESLVLNNNSRKSSTPLR